MKHFIIGFMALVIIFLTGCAEPAKHQENVYWAKRIDVHWTDEDGYEGAECFTIIEIDGCEYLLAQHDRSRIVTHKGNCRFCRERNKK